jgi:hypothetical protein
VNGSDIKGGSASDRRVVMVEIGIGIEIDANRRKSDSDPDFDLEQMGRCCIATTWLLCEDAGRSRSSSSRSGSPSLQPDHDLDGERCHAAHHPPHCERAFRKREKISCNEVGRERCRSAALAFWGECPSF